MRNEGNHIPSQTLLIGANGHLYPPIPKSRHAVAADDVSDAIGKEVKNMRDNCKDVVRTKCSYIYSVLLCGVAVLVEIIFIYAEASIFQKIVFPALALIGAICALRQYAFSERGVTIEVFRIPIRRIKWKDIKQVGVITYNIYYLQIVTRDAERYKPYMNTKLYRQNYASRNLFKVFTVPYHQEYDEVIQKYYGDYDYFEKYDT